MTISAAIQAAAWRIRRAARSRYYIARLTPWTSGLIVTTGDYVRSFGLAWRALNSGTTGTSPPTNALGAASNDGAVTWLHVPMLFVEQPTIA